MESVTNFPPFGIVIFVHFSGIQLIKKFLNKHKHFIMWHIICIMTVPNSPLPFSTFCTQKSLQKMNTHSCKIIIIKKN